MFHSSFSKWTQTLGFGRSHCYYIIRAVDFMAEYSKEQLCYIERPHQTLALSAAAGAASALTSPADSAGAEPVVAAAAAEVFAAACPAGAALLLVASGCLAVVRFRTAGLLTFRLLAAARKSRDVAKKPSKWEWKGQARFSAKYETAVPERKKCCPPFSSVLGFCAGWDHQEK